MALAPNAGAISKVQFFLVLGMILFVLLPVCAAAMARGYGLFLPN